jgi:hypothetical protein
MYNIISSLTSSWTLLIVSLGGLFVTVGSVIISIEYVRSPKWKLYATIITITGAFMSVTGGWIMNVQQNKDSDKILKLSIEVNKKSDEIKKLTDKISLLNEEIVKNVTGGDAYCYLLPSIDANKDVNFRLKHQGEYPLYNVGINISKSPDYRLYSSLYNSQHYQDELKNSCTIYLPLEQSEHYDYITKHKEMLANELMDEANTRKSVVKSKYFESITSDINHSNKEIYSFKLLPNKDDYFFLIHIATRNHSYWQSVYFHHNVDDKNWEMKSIVYTLRPDKMFKNLEGTFVGDFFIIKERPLSKLNVIRF